MNGLSLLRFVFFLRNTHQASDLTMAMTMLTTFSCCWFCTFFPCCNVVCQNLQCCVSKFAIFYPLVNTVIAVNGQWQQNNEGINDDRFTEVLIKIDDCDGDTDSDDSDNNDDTFANETSHPSSGLDNLQRISEKCCNGCRGGTFSMRIIMIGKKIKKIHHVTKPKK